MEPTYRPDPKRPSVDSTNATVQDVGEALVAVATRAQEWDATHSEMEGLALIGTIQRMRKVLDMLERHAISDVSKVSRNVVPRRAKRLRDPKSLRSLL